MFSPVGPASISMYTNIKCTDSINIKLQYFKKKNTIFFLRCCFWIFYTCTHTHHHHVPNIWIVYIHARTRIPRLRILIRKTKIIFLLCKLLLLFYWPNILKSSRAVFFSFSLIGFLWCISWVFFLIRANLCFQWNAIHLLNVHESTLACLLKRSPFIIFVDITSYLITFASHYKLAIGRGEGEKRRSYSPKKNSKHVNRLHVRFFSFSSWISCEFLNSLSGIFRSQNCTIFFWENANKKSV